MAAPTPVSALVHSSTLVTAGLLFLIKVGVCGLFLTWVGCFTFFLGGLLACVDVDCKKVVAFSTLSQLGMMFFCFSFGLVYLASLHVYLHAFFKSALFIMVGYGIITRFHNQVSGRISFGLDVMCRLLTFVSFLSMVGVIFFSGFFSKHLIFFFLTSFSGLFIFVFFLCCLFTLFYRVRFFLFFSSFGHVLVGGRFPFFIFFCVFFSGLVGYFLFFETPVNFFFVELGTWLMFFFFLIGSFFTYLYDYFQFLFFSSFVLLRLFFLSRLNSGFVDGPVVLDGLIGNFSFGLRLRGWLIVSLVGCVFLVFPLFFVFFYLFFCFDRAFCFEVVCEQVVNLIIYICFVISC